MQGTCQDSRPIKFSFRHRRKGSHAVYRFYQEGSQRLARRLERLLGISVQARVGEIRLGIWESTFCDGYVLAFREGDFGETGYIQIERQLVHLILQRLLGMEERVDWGNRELTLLQQGVLRSVVKGQLDNFALPTCVDLATFQGLHPSADSMLVGIRLQIGSLAGMMHLLLPQSLVGPRPSPPRLEERSLTLTACLGEGELTLTELLELKCGDVVVLGSTREPLPVYIGQRHWLQARPGIYGSHIGIQITDILHEGDRSCE